MNQLMPIDIHTLEKFDSLAIAMAEKGVSEVTLNGPVARTAANVFYPVVEVGEPKSYPQQPFEISLDRDENVLLLSVEPTNGLTGFPVEAPGDEDPAAKEAGEPVGYFALRARIYFKKGESQSQGTDGVSEESLCAVGMISVAEQPDGSEVLMPDQMDARRFFRRMAGYGALSLTTRHNPSEATADVTV
jgi:hypothetical protein